MLKRILFVLGASGTGKTTALGKLEERRLPGVSIRYFDSIGVPSAEAMALTVGGPEAWQASATADWVQRLLHEAGELAVLEGQTRPSFVLEAAHGQPGLAIRMLLLDCAPGVRVERLRARGGSGDGDAESAWAAYLRGQADALGMPVVDTTALTEAEVADRLEAELQVLMEMSALQPEQRTYGA